MMMTFLRLFAVLATATISVFGQGANVRELSFYEMPNVQGQSDGNGRLKAAVWETIPTAEKFFVYWKVEPIPGDIHSGLQMAYDSDGIYLRITNHEEHLDKLRALIEKRGDPDLWTDDCVQIYFDPNPNGSGYVTFTVNSMGSQHDRKQLDAAVSLPEWRGEGWQVWTSQVGKSWIVEAFFPFSDFGAQGRPGDLWSFNLVRFAYTSGAFQGITWSVGGNYISRGNFGYLYFGGIKGSPPAKIAEILERSATSPWMVAADEDVVLRYGSGPAEILSPAAVSHKLSGQAQEIFSRLEPFSRADLPVGEKVKDLKRRADVLKYDTAQDALDSITLMTAIMADAWQIYWNEMLYSLVEDTAGTPSSNKP